MSDQQLSPGHPVEDSPGILVLHGPNLHMLGRRESAIYRRVTLEKLNATLHEAARKRGATPSSPWSSPR